MKNLTFYFLGLTYMVCLSNIVLAQSVNPIKNNLTLGGSIWGEDDLNCVKDNNEIGGFNVLVNLFNGSGIEIDSTFADSLGNYMFSGLEEGTYTVQLDAKNFISGKPLYGLTSCCGSGLPDNDIDHDDQGDGDGPIVSTPIVLQHGTEPGLNGNENFTIDFCTRADCGVPNPLTSPSCNTVIDTICDLHILNILCSRMPTPPLIGPAPDQLCAGSGMPNNMSWFAFVAGGGTWSIDLDIYACAGGQNGAQFGIYSMDEQCDFANAVEIYCQSLPCVLGLQTISNENLIPGKTYYLWLDGCAGSVCSYTIDINGNFQQYQVPEITSIECASTFGRCDTICPNNEVVFEARDGYDDTDAVFHWRITSPSGIIDNIIAYDRFLHYDFGSELGTYLVTLLNIDVKCSLPINPRTIQLVVAPLPGECSVGVSEMNIEDLVEIHPNPSSGILNIEFKESNFTEANIAISSIDGKVLMHKSIDGHTAKTSIDISQFAIGTYLVEIVMDKNKFNRKIVLMK